MHFKREVAMELKRNIKIYVDTRRNGKGLKEVFSFRNHEETIFTKRFWKCRQLEEIKDTLKDPYGNEFRRLMQNSVENLVDILHKIIDGVW